MNQKQIATKSAIYLIGNLSSKFISAALIPIYAFFVATADLGTFDYSQSVMNVLVPVLYIAFWEGVLKFVLISEEGEKIKVINIAATFGVFSSITYSIIILIGTGLSSTPVVWVCTGGMVITHGLAWIWQYACRALQQTKRYLFASVLSAAVLLAATILFVCALDMGLVGLYLSYILGQLTLFVGIEVRIRILKQVSLKSIDWLLLKQIVQFSVPLMFNTLSMWLVPLLMRTIILNRISTEANGLYAFANKFNIVVNLLGTVVSMALVEEAIITSKRGTVSEDYGITVSQIFVKFEQLTSTAIMMIAVAYSLLRTTEYYVTIHYFAWFLWAALIAILGSYIGTVFQSINITKYQFTTTLLGGGVGVIAAYFLTPQYALWGIVVGQMLSCIVTTMSRYSIVCKKSAFRMEWKPVMLNGFPVFVAVLISTFCTSVCIKVACMVLYIIMVIVMNAEIIEKARRRILR